MLMKLTTGLTIMIVAPEVSPNQGFTEGKRLFKGSSLGLWQSSNMVLNSVEDHLSAKFIYSPLHTA